VLNWKSGFVTMIFCVTAGCASSEPAPGSLEAIKREARQEHYKQCVNVLFREFHEEIMAGFYDSHSLVGACREWARRRVR